MKKAITLFALTAMLITTVQGQALRRSDAGKGGKEKAVAKLSRPTAGTKSANDTISVFPWAESFENEAMEQNWTLSTGNATGDNGFVITNNAAYARTGNCCLFGTYSDDVNTDQWAVSPVLAIPTDASGYTLRFYVYTTEWEGIATHLEVRLSTGSANTTDFTTLLLDMSNNLNDWERRTIDLDSYAGQTIRIAFHNITPMGGDAMMIDDVRLGGPEPPELTIAGPTTVVLGDEATYSATTTASSLQWYVDGMVESETGLMLEHTFTTAGAHQVVAQATNTAGDSYDTLDINVVDCGDGIATFPYTEGFESEVPCWYFISADPANDEMTGIVYDEYHGGFASYALSSYNSAADYNQYLITPEITLPTGSSYVVDFWYKGDAVSDAFRVKVSTTTHDTAAFTTVLADYPTVSTEWTHVALELPEGTKYIAFNYYGDYAFYLYIDDFTIDEMGAPFITVSGPDAIGTNREATFTAMANLAESIAWSIDGNTLPDTGTTMTYTFTAAGTYTIVAEATNTYGTAADTTYIEVYACETLALPMTADFSQGLRCWNTRSDLEEGFGWFPSNEIFEEGEVVGQVLSMSAVSFFGMIFPVDVDNWLISPEMAMPSEGSFDVAWKVMPYTTQYASDHYAVYVISEGEETMIYEETLSPYVTSFSQRVASIPATVGGEFQIAFRHWNSENGYVVILDDIKIVNSGTVTGIEDADAAKVAVYPNPVSQMLNVAGDGISRVEILDMSGRTVITTTGTAIDLSNIASGMYMVRVTTESGMYTNKIVKR